jgi:hypothetical protein
MGHRTAKMVELCVAASRDDTSTSIAWPGGIERHYESGRLHREEGPAVVIKGTFEAWYQRGDPHRIGAAAFELATARVSSLMREQILNSRCSAMFMQVYCRNILTWLTTGRICMLDSYMFTLFPSAQYIESEWRTWYCSGEVRGTTKTFAASSANTEFARGLKYPDISPAVSLGTRLTDLYLALMEVAGPMFYLRCITCNASFKTSELESPIRKTAISKTVRYAGCVRCK